jgi:hypothetical protein
MEFDELSNQVIRAPDQFQCQKAQKWDQTIRFITLRALRVLRGATYQLKK